MILQPEKINSNFPVKKQVDLAARNDQNIFRALNQIDERIRKIESTIIAINKLGTYIYSHHLSHEPGGNDEVAAWAIGLLDDDPEPEEGKILVYRKKSDPWTVRAMTEDGAIRTINISEPIN